MGFRLVPKSLNDLQQHNGRVVCVISPNLVAFGAYYIKVVEDTPFILGVKCSLKNSLNRRDSSLLNRVQLGHTRLTHSHFLSGEPPPVCSVCQIPLTVQHFMLDCPQFTVKRAKFYCLIT